MSRPLCVFLVVGCVTTAFGSDHVGLSAWTPEIYSIGASGASQLIGSHVLVAPEEIRMAALARGLDDVLYGISDSQNESRVYRFNESNGAATSVFTIPTGPVTPGGATFDPTTGDLYYTNTFGFVPWPQVYRVDLEAGTVAFLGNIGPVIQNSQIGPAFDPAGRMYTVNVDQHVLQQIDKDDPHNGSLVVGPIGGSIDLLNNSALFWDPTLQSLVLYEGATGKLYTVDRSTGTATAIAGVSGIAPAMVDIENGPCDGSAIAYGTGCAGSGGFVPRLQLHGCPVVGNTVLLEVDQALGGSVALLFFGATTASFPLGGGCTYYLAPVLAPFAALPLLGSGPGDGSLVISGGIPAGAANTLFTMQAIVLDSGSPIGGATTNGIQVSVP